MSESEAVTRAASAASGLLPSLDPLLRPWLPRQRWFAGKGRPVSGFSLVAATELLPPGGRIGLYHLLVRAHQPPRGDCYQLLIGTREALPPRLAPALIGHVTEGPLAGRTVYDALYDPRPAEVLLEALRSRARIGGLRFERDEDAEPGAAIPPGLVPRLSTAEQSNSSVVYGDAYVLKLFRRIAPGVNPDLELPLALAREGCARVPAPTGWIRADLGGEPLVLGVLQPFLPGVTDGWELALRERAKGQDFTAEARELGRATADVHTTLARALPVVTLGPAQLEPLVAGMRGRLDAAVRAVPALLPYAPGLRAAFDALAGIAPGSRTAQRVHGDLHLGQCLRDPSGRWSLIDFEGEPARPLAERRMPQPVVRDIAGMLRSFDYAARSARPPVPEDTAAAWAGACRDAYCAGYAEVTGADPRADAVLLRAYETDKAVYEVVYEARHRPDWLGVPLSAVARLTSG
ncbi:phosphotransferase [Streptomyces sp. NPDC048290]|uniref:maltokinase N-terminal cap-like domain-containing protein n=1 Tax=Streptomyces sp. NPDC048290 TaxID=3155811 RepID=UPI0034133C70